MLFLYEWKSKHNAAAAARNINAAFGNGSVNEHFEISSAFLLRNQNDPFLNRIVTFDEKWIRYDNRKSSAQ